MYCSKCGTQLSENAKFCKKCGFAVTSPEAEAKPNPFAFVSAGIMAVMFFLHFLPWFEDNTKSYTFFGYYLGRMPVDEAPSRLYIILLLGTMALLLSGAVTAIIRKNHVPIIFAILSSACIVQAPIVYLFSVEAWAVNITSVPFVIFLLTLINIPFAILAKRK